MPADSALAIRLSHALASSGPLGSLFARFLIGRCDLLSEDYLAALAGVPLDVPAIDRERFIFELTAELDVTGELLARQLAFEACWTIPGRCAYRTTYEGEELVVQLSRRPPAPSDIREFLRDLSALDREALGAVTGSGVRRQFEEWLYLNEPPGQERAFLEKLAGLHRHTLAEYPRMLPRFSSGQALCWHWPEGEPLSSVLDRGDPKCARKLAEAVLEQLCLLSTVEGLLDVRAFHLSPQGRVIVRRITRPLVVPIGRGEIVLRYLAGILTENSTDSAAWLLQLCGSDHSPQVVSQLLGAIAAIQPQLVRRDPTPGSAAALEGSWRALSTLAIEPPLYVAYLHRNLIAAGSLHPSDPLREAHAGLLGTMLRNSLTDAVQPNALREWAFGASLATLEMSGALGHIAGNLRDGRRGPRHEPSRGRELHNRRLRHSIITAMLLVFFLACLKLGPLTQQPWSTLLLACAVFSSFALFWTVSRFR